MNLTGSNVLVIGASGVLGGQIARELSARGATVLGTASTEASLAKVPEIVAAKFVVDLNDEMSFIPFFVEVAANGLPLDGIVVAAGRVGFGPINDTVAADAKELMQINHFGAAELIASLSTIMRENSENSFVLSITGVVAEKVFPGMSAYTTSKTAHSTWLKAFALEARRRKIRVIDARPGHTETGLATRPLFGTAPAFGAGMTPEHVAKVIVDGIESGATELPSESFS